MKRLWIFILYLAFSCQLSAVSGLVSGCELRAMSNEQSAQGSQPISHSSTTVDYYENQIRLADSLYKNYLPQYNFEEVKAAVEFFDSVQLSAISRQRWRLFNKKADNENILIAESRLLTAATAHYYHAVGLTERDDIVGACEHYLRALEIMEEMMAKDKRLKAKGKEKAHGSQLEAHSPEYEKMRFVSLIYTRLGELFYNESYCHLSIIKYKKALNYVEMLNNNGAKSQIYKLLGNSYQLSYMPDSALYYYDKSTETNSDLINKLDVEKSVALILFENGAKDSAFALIKSNLCKIENIYVRDSYYTTIGGMFYNEHKYDSAIYYLEKSVISNNNYIKHQSSLILSAIYDSIGKQEKKTYYVEIVSKLSMNMVNKSVIRGEIQDVYDKYKERKVEKEKIKSTTRTKVIAISLSAPVIIVFVITILIWHKSKRKDRIHQESLNEKDRYIANKEEVISRTNEEIERKESGIKKLVEMSKDHRSDIKSLKNDAAIKEEEISCKETDIKKLENDLSAKEMELKKLQKNVHENRILIDRLNEDRIVKQKQIECYLAEIDDNRQVINDKNHLISIATEGLTARKDAIAENRNEIARLQAIIGKNEKVINELSEDYRNNKEQIAAYIEEIEKLKTEISETQKNLIDLRFKNSLTEGRIKRQNAELKKKEKLIRKYTTEISNLKYRSERNHVDISNLNNYLQSDICSKILNEIKDISEKKLKSNMLSPLSKAEFVLLLNSANHHLNHLINDMAKKYPKLKKEDLYYLCLFIMGLNNNQIASLYGVTYQASKKRKNKICVILGLDSKTNLYNYLLHLV